jgi:Na+/H+ antiporter NhaC
VKKIVFLFCLTLAGLTFSQTREVYLTGIPFTVTIEDSANFHTAVFVKNEKGKTVAKFASAGEKRKLEIDEAGNYVVFAGEKKLKEVRIIPAWFAIVPPLVAILLALIFRQVLLALFAGIFVGEFFIYDYNPFIAFYKIGDTLLPEILSDPDHVLIILFTILIGGVVGIISANGGTKGMAEIIIKKAKTARSGMLASWFLGVAIFFDDYSNSLIVGNMMRPITDKQKISREKLAYIVDSTAAPVTSLVVVSTWIGYELGLIGSGLKSVGSPLSAYEVFIESVAYRFYPVAALVFVFMVAFFKRDFGPMYKAEINARKFGVAQYKNKNSDDISALENLSEKPRWFNAVIPIFVLIAGTLAGLYVTGKSALVASGASEFGLREIISASNSYYALIWGSFTATAVAIMMTLAQKIITLEQTLDAFVKGLRSMFVPVVILSLAWGIGKITADVKTADYFISGLVDFVNIKFLAALVFVVCALTSFATGTSWGTMAIVMPIVIPLTAELGAHAGLPTHEINFYLVSVIASVLAGSVFGDHCSPIADTTILSSLASGCNHIAHVQTQLPYALLVGATSLVFGSLLTALGVPLIIAYVLIFVSLAATLFLFGKKTEI